MCELARKLASPFGHPTMQISTQVQLLVACDYLQGHLARALDIYRDVAKGRLPAYFFSWPLTQKQRLEKTLLHPYIYGMMLIRIIQNTSLLITVAFLMCLHSA